MTRLRIFWQSLFDVRPGEYLRTTCLTLYLMLVLFAYYILKPVSRAIFLNKFDIDKLPWLYVLIAAVGGVLAYFYTKMAVDSSLRKAVNVDFAADSAVECWGARFRPPDYAWTDPITGQTLRLDVATDAERRDLWRRVSRSRIVQFDWETSDNLSDSQLERLVAILDERD